MEHILTKVTDWNEVLEILKNDGKVTKVITNMPPREPFRLRSKGIEFVFNAFIYGELYKVEEMIKVTEFTEKCELIRDGVQLYIQQPISKNYTASEMTRNTSIQSIINSGDLNYYVKESDVS